VQADEAAFKKTQESERAKLAHIRKVQENVDRTREQNAKRKMDKIQSREWDSGKPTGDWKQQLEKPESVHNLSTDVVENSPSYPKPGSPSRVGGERTRGGSHWRVSQRGTVKGRSGSGAAQGVEGSPTNSVPVDNMEPAPS